MPAPTSLAQASSNHGEVATLKLLKKTPIDPTKPAATTPRDSELIPVIRFPPPRPPSADDYYSNAR
jgi:hypothetical protein